VKLTADRSAGAAVALLLLCAPAAAQDAAPCGGADLVAKAKTERPEAFAAFEAEARRVPNAEGLLWRIEPKAQADERARPDAVRPAAAQPAPEADGRPGAPAPSYLFGTMHVTEPDLVALSEPVREALGGSRSVAVELADARGAAAQAELAAYVTKNAIDASGQGLAGLTEAQAAGIRKRLGQIGMPGAIAPMLKPWFLAVSLQVSGCQLKQMAAGAPTVDQAVEAVGREHGLRVVGLETVKEQLDAVSKLSDETARRMLRDAVADETSSRDLQATTLALYRARRVGWYLAMKGETFGEALDLSAYADFMEGVVDARNRLMLQRSKPLIQEGGAFVAVGALHLPGPNGLVELLRREGYAVTKVW
jgi:uncharacterized protein